MLTPEQMANLLKQVANTTTKKNTGTVNPYITDIEPTDSLLQGCEKNGTKAEIYEGPILVRVLRKAQDITSEYEDAADEYRVVGFGMKKPLANGQEVWEGNIIRTIYDNGSQELWEAMETAAETIGEENLCVERKDKLAKEDQFEVTAKVVRLIYPEPYICYETDKDGNRKPMTGRKGRVAKKYDEYLLIGMDESDKTQSYIRSAIYSRLDDFGEVGAKDSAPKEESEKETK
jgi:hypothetical protein